MRSPRRSSGRTTHTSAVVARRSTKGTAGVARAGRSAERSRSPARTTAPAPPLRPPETPMTDKTLLRARRRRKVEILRYRLAVRIGGWVLREDEAELKALRSQLAAIRELRAY